MVDVYFPVVEFNILLHKILATGYIPYLVCKDGNTYT